MSIGVKLSQTIYSERDKSKPCVNYPTEKYVSYEDCDRCTVYQKVLDKFNLVPFWSARSLDEVSMTRYPATLGRLGIHGVEGCLALRGKGQE